MRIALVHPRLDHRGGAENVVCWMARGLLKRGHDVIVATRYFSLELWNEKDWAGIPRVVLGKGRLDRFKLRAARKRGVGDRLRRAIGPRDVIIAHNSPAPMWAVVAARGMRTRVVWFCEEPTARFFWQETMPHLAAAAADPDRPAWLRAMADRAADRSAKDESGPNFAIDRELERDSAPRIDLTLANSAFTAGNVARAYGIRARPCLLGMPEPAPAAVARGEPYVAWVTAPIEHKNAYGFLEALQIAVHEFGARDLRVRAVGLRGSAFEGRIAELALGGVVHCESRLSDADLNELIAGCRLLAYPPIDEPFGLLPLHAMAHARAVLASSTGGPAETVIDGVTGALVDPLDPRAIATRLVDLWRAPERCDALGAAGRARYLANFTFDHFLDRFEALALRN
ncbi:MAG: glycosyltransferase family 4 protein [Deltaproteobacteria bacterium]|nr:MAG: glycosyltransferase family 4 protein [Deltaproteobacteria bacterium]